MNDLQKEYTAFYNLVEDTVLSIKNNSLKKDDIDDLFSSFSNVGHFLTRAVIGFACGSIIGSNLIIPSTKYDFSISNIINDSITLHNRIYGDFIDEKYKSAFIELAKNRNSNGILKLAKDAVKAIINAEL